MGGEAPNIENSQQLGTEGEEPCPGHRHSGGLVDDHDPTELEVDRRGVWRGSSWWFSFPENDSANEEPWTLCLLEPSQLPLPLCKSVLVSLLCGELAYGVLAYDSPWLQTLNCDSLLITNKSLLE